MSMWQERELCHIDGKITENRGRAMAFGAREEGQQKD
jgi:hypothetical protein